MHARKMETFDTSQSPIAECADILKYAGKAGTSFARTKAKSMIAIQKTIVKMKEM
jgi:hypothetical protein